MTHDETKPNQTKLLTILLILALNLFLHLLTVEVPTDAGGADPGGNGRWIPHQSPQNDLVHDQVDAQLYGYGVPGQLRDLESSEYT